MYLKHIARECEFSTFLTFRIYSNLNTVYYLCTQIITMDRGTIETLVKCSRSFDHSQTGSSFPFWRYYLESGNVPVEMTQLLIFHYKVMAIYFSSLYWSRQCNLCPNESISGRLQFIKINLFENLLLLNILYKSCLRYLYSYNAKRHICLLGVQYSIMRSSE